MPVEVDIDQLFVETYDAETEEVLIPGRGWVSAWTNEGREYLENKEADELEDEGQVAPGFHSEAAIEAFLSANPDSLESIPEGAKGYNLSDQEWSAAVEVGDLTHLFEGGI